MQRRIEQPEVDLGIGRQSEMRLAALIPDHLVQRQRAVEGAELRRVDRKLELLLQFACAVLRAADRINLVANLILPLTTAARLANVATPQSNALVSPSTRMTSSGLTPS